MSCFNKEGCVYNVIDFVLKQMFKDFDNAGSVNSSKDIIKNVQKMIPRSVS